ncbi:MAG: VCBS repeat-containing protein [Planctomycetales bacterium]|nr:VCBS repeat-containing protein [Planctomycetales bacterium]MCA9170584.1 VCBS repeat-containing protein [Planctomycetales bacterium]
MSFRIFASAVLRQNRSAHTRKPAAVKRRQYHLRQSGTERLELRTMLSSTQFGESQVILEAELAELKSVVAADIDHDGDQDLVAASWRDDKVVWYENLDGTGRFGEQQVITTDAKHAQCVFVADIDGDDDLDVLSASSEDDKLAWYPNLDGAGKFGEAIIISTQLDYPLDIVAADLDGDGDLDVLSAGNDDGDIAWFENQDGLGTFGPQQVIANKKYVVQVAVADLDGDGDVDIVAASYRGSVDWFANDGSKGFELAGSIDSASTLLHRIQLLDADGDGDQDLAVATIGSTSEQVAQLAWYENTDGLGGFTQRHNIAGQLWGYVAMGAADIDGDGDLDLLATSPHFSLNTSPPMPQVYWYENADGDGSFVQYVVTEATLGSSPRAVSAADLESDGDLDILAGVGTDIATSACNREIGEQD